MPTEENADPSQQIDFAGELAETSGGNALGWEWLHSFVSNWESYVNAWMRWDLGKRQVGKTSNNIMNAILSTKGILIIFGSIILIKKL